MDKSNKTANKSTTIETLDIPENFLSIVADFTKDLTLTFPEYAYLWSMWTNVEDITEADKNCLFGYFLSVYPERFFDILYQNTDIFVAKQTKPSEPSEPSEQSEQQTQSHEEDVNTMFLPNVDFKMLFHCEGVSENTKKTIWKYLQLVLFTVIGGVKDKNTFGNTANLFDGIDEADLQSKLRETMEGIGDFFKNVSHVSPENDSGSGPEVTSNPEFEKMFENMPKPEEFNDFTKSFGIPNIENMQEHLKSLFNGKIGSLAKDMAEEISGEFADLLGEDMNGATDSGDVMKKLMKDPKKIMDLMKTVGSKLDKKMQNGEISKDELLKEASELFSKMKGMGGGDQFNELFKNFTKSMGGMGKNMRMDTNALDRMTKKNTMRERLLKKLELKKQQDQLKNQMVYGAAPTTQSSTSTTSTSYSLQQTHDPNHLVFRLPEEG